ncbi:MAG: TPM domain-containing protein [Chitinophagales bacterium]|nr:TPM domain-containing protein [Chitinophagales bacterium]
MANAKHFLTDAEKNRITDAIKIAENNTTGEIRVHIENHCNTATIVRAEAVFNMLNMHQTKNRNGVLIYIAVKDKQFAIVGDEAIDHSTPIDYWTALCNELAVNFKNGNYANGIVAIVEKVGKELHRHFPLLHTNNPDELSNEISFDEN